MINHSLSGSLSPTMMNGTKSTTDRFDPDIGTIDVTSLPVGNKMHTVIICYISRLLYLPEYSSSALVPANFQINQSRRGQKSIFQMFVRCQFLHITKYMYTWDTHCCLIHMWWVELNYSSKTFLYHKSLKCGSSFLHM